MGRVSAERLSEQIAEDCRKISGAVPIEKAVAGRLRNAVGFDAWCALTVDPALVMSTGGYHDEGVAPDRVPQLVQIEASGEDFNALAAIARSPRPVATLARATGGELERSRRYTEVITPSCVASHPPQNARRPAEVIGEALRLAARGEGHRRIARQLGRLPGTVRGWLRAARARARACERAV